MSYVWTFGIGVLLGAGCILAAWYSFGRRLLKDVTDMRYRGFEVQRPLPPMKTIVTPDQEIRED